MRLTWNANHTRIVLRGMEHADIDPLALMRRSATPGVEGRRPKRRSTGQASSSDRAIRRSVTTDDVDERPRTAAAQFDRPRHKTTTHAELQQRRARASGSVVVDVWRRDDWEPGAGGGEDFDRSGPGAAMGPVPCFTTPTSASSPDKLAGLSCLAVSPSAGAYASGDGCVGVTSRSTNAGADRYGDAGAERDVVDMHLLSGSTRELLHTVTSSSAGLRGDEHV